MTRRQEDLDQGWTKDGYSARREGLDVRNRRKFYNRKSHEDPKVLLLNLERREFPDINKGTGTRVQGLLSTESASFSRCKQAKVTADWLLEFPSHVRLALCAWRYAHKPECFRFLGLMMMMMMTLMMMMMMMMMVCYFESALPCLHRPRLQRVGGWAKHRHSSGRRDKDRIDGWSAIKESIRQAFQSFRDLLGPSLLGEFLKHQGCIKDSSGFHGDANRWSVWEERPNNKLFTPTTSWSIFRKIFFGPLESVGRIDGCCEVKNNFHTVLKNRATTNYLVIPKNRVTSQCKEYLKISMSLVLAIVNERFTRKCYALHKC